jgi:RNA polymerase sigma-70 factor (ECF subfamily)
LANQRRGVRRQERLGERLARALPGGPVDEPGTISQRLHVEAALAALPDDDAELLRLTTWEGLSPAEVAVVLDLSPTATRSRIHRARRRLRSELASDDSTPSLGSEGAAP